MNMPQNGFLLVFMNPPTAFEEEFNAWYDTEHIPERLAVPGFLTGLRYINVSSGAPRFVAMYDLTHFGVLESPEYLRVAYDNSSPWTKRVTARARVQRFAGHQIAPGDAVTGRSARIGIIRFRNLAEAQIADVSAGLAATYTGRAEVVRYRVLVDPSPSEGVDVIGFIEARAPLCMDFDPNDFGRAKESVDLVTSYNPF